TLWYTGHFLGPATLGSFEFVLALLIQVSNLVLEPIRSRRRRRLRRCLDEFIKCLTLARGQRSLLQLPPRQFPQQSPPTFYFYFQHKISQRQRHTLPSCLCRSRKAFFLRSVDR